jgi:predicted phage tail protein
MMESGILTPRNRLAGAPAELLHVAVSTHHVDADRDVAPRLRQAQKIVQVRAEAGALLGGGATALLGAVLGAVFTVGRGLIPDLGTTLAVGLLGILLFALAGGFLGALAGGTIGGLAGALEAGRFLMTGRDRA